MQPVQTHHRIDARGAHRAPWVTFVTGIANDQSMWDGQVPALADDFRILRYDLRRQGRTPATDPPYCLALLAEDLVALCCASALLGLDIEESLPRIRARHVSVPGASHIANIQNPAGFNRVIVDFLQEA